MSSLPAGQIAIIAIGVPGAPKPIDDVMLTAGVSVSLLSSTPSGQSAGVLSPGSIVDTG